jgi:hypothetical protein
VPPRLLPVGPYPRVRVPGARRGCRERHDPPAGLGRFVPAVVLADDEQARVLAAAERAGVGHRRPLPRPGPGKAQRGDDAVGQPLECDQESVQVGDHDDFPRPDVCEHADLGHSSITLQPAPNPRSPI